MNYCLWDDEYTRFVAAMKQKLRVSSEWIFTTSLMSYNRKQKAGKQTFHLSFVSKYEQKCFKEHQ